MALQELRDPPVDVYYLDATHHLGAADLRKVLPDVGSQVRRERCEKHPLPFFQVLGQPSGAMHRDNGLAGSRTTQHPHRAVGIHFNELPLCRMQKHAPLLERSLQDLL